MTVSMFPVLKGSGTSTSIGRQSGICNAMHVSVATCGEAAKLHSKIKNVNYRVDSLEEYLYGVTRDLGDSVKKLDVQVAALQGEGEELLLLGADIENSFIPVCQINSQLEASVLCQLAYPGQITNPFFTHVNCKSELAMAAGLKCYDSSIMFERDCIVPNGKTEAELLKCASLSKTSCENVPFIACFGFTDQIPMRNEGARMPMMNVYDLLRSK
ncbi:uncharacterized protein LOC143294563 [Babylonia areolata]|uniref:uncharacterized protein LOC143294563 n=1 Tax=Babylonia areolata TaxID=304850 RepID=UPI003FD08ACC